MAAPVDQQRRIDRPLLGVMLAVAVLGLGLAARLVVGWSDPLTFDETFSGVIASQRDATGLLAWCLRELTGPAYYMPLWLWDRIAGDSNAALRLPSLAWSLAVPLLIARFGHPRREVRLGWAVLALLWLPGLEMAVEARPYAQLFALACLQAVAFRRLLAAPATAPAVAWSIVSAAMTLTHYYALPICTIQGLTFLAVERRRALACWPAVLPWLAVAAWITVHLPQVLAFAAVPGAHYAVLGPGDLALAPVMIVGGVVPGLALFAVIAITGWRDVATVRVTPDRLVVWTGIAAFAAVLALGFVRPSFAPRYLTPAVPSLLFGIALWAAQARARLFVTIAMLVVLVLGVMRDALTDRVPPGVDLNLETPSAWLAERSPARLVFFWDSVIGAYARPDDMAAIAGFHLRRAGHSVTVTVANVPAGADATAAILAATGSDAAILWRTSDVMLDSSHADRWPDMKRLGAGRDCRRFATVGMVACRQRQVSRNGRISRR